MNRAIEGARRKGRQAYLDGKLKRDCPYPDKRTPQGFNTWSRAFIIAWLDGWEEAAKEVEKENEVSKRCVT